MIVNVFIYKITPILFIFNTFRLFLVAWLDHSKTLRQQNIENESILILKRKFFFSDKNIDTRDPIQLNLLYVQCRDAILNGTHPINEEEAIKFAAIQCKVKNLDNNEILNKSGCLE